MKRRDGPEARIEVKNGFSLFFLVVQAAMLGVFVFGDIGFDHPGRFGLSWNHDVLLLIGYGMALLLGLTCALFEGAWGVGSLQAGMLALVIAYDQWPAPVYSAAEHQHLIGKTREEVERVLSPRGRVTGIVTDQGKSLENWSYRGMTVYFANDGRVVEVEDNLR